MQERLQKIIAASGIASRRKAEELILNGEVTVNGKIVTELGTKADPENDHIKVRNRLLNPKLTQKENLYLLLNKPLGYLSSTSDPKKRPLVTDLVGEFRDQVHPVGRLDFNSEGLLLLSNDGTFTNLVAHASSKVPKKYEVKVKGQPGDSQIDRLRRGVVIENRKTARAEIKLIEQSKTNAWYEVVLYEGRNQQIRKMFDFIGHSVIKLRRIGIGFLSLQKERLRPGQFRQLSESEVRRFFRENQGSGAKSAAARASRLNSGQA